MLKGVGPHGKDRRPERVVNLTDEFVANLPEPASYSDVFWDAENPDLCVMKAKRGTLWRMKTTKGERDRLGIDANTALIRVGYDMLVAEARAKYREYKAAIKNKTPLFTGNSAEVQKLLDDKPGDGQRGYEALMSILMDAYAQAAEGKGNDRHSNGQAFERQDMIKIILATSPDFAIGQAIKKMLESRRLGEKGRVAMQRAELLGAIVYAAGAVVALDQAKGRPVREPEEEKQEEAA